MRTEGGMKAMRVLGLLIAIFTILFAGWLKAEEKTSSAPVTGNRLTLISKNAPLATIVLSKTATISAKFAAQELQYHLRKITGTNLPIVADDVTVSGTRILVGESEATRKLGLYNRDFKNQEYLIRFLPDTLVLIGKDKPDFPSGSTPVNPPAYLDEQGTCYAVYDFLERFCGIRWYLPTELGLVYTPRDTLEVSGTEIRRAPAMKYRGDWHFVFPADLCGDTIKEPGVKLVNLPDQEVSLFFSRQRHGGEPFVVYHSFEEYYDRFWAKNPEWFGRGYNDRSAPMCLTNPDFIKQVIQDGRDFFDGKRTTGGRGNYFILGAMDNRNYCKCPDCQAFFQEDATRGNDSFANDKASNYWFAFINKVARELKKTHPDKYVATFAYADNTYPPSREQVESNVAVELCLGPRMYYNPEGRQNEIAALNSWIAQPQKPQIYLRLYFCFPSLVSISKFRCFPGFFAHTLIQEMERYHKAGVRGIYIEPSYLASGQRSALLDQVEEYLLWKLADDPANGEKLFDEFFTRYYGAAAKPMKKFYEKVEQIYNDPANYPPNPGHQTEEIAWGMLGTEKRMAELGKLMEEAKVLTTTTIEKERVALFEKGVWQYMMKGGESYWSQLRMTKEVWDKYKPPSGKELVAYWNFDDGEGTIAKDISGNNNNATLKNMPPATCWVEGKKGKALYFRTGDYVDCGNSGSLEIKTSFTYSAWIKIDGFNTYNNVIGKSGIWGRSLHVRHTAQLRGYISHVTRAADSYGGAVPAGVWTHVAMVFKYPKIYLYQNGVAVPPGAPPTQSEGAETSLITTNLHIGDACGGFRGTIDEVRIYNRALSSEEINAQYQLDVDGKNE